MGDDWRPIKTAPEDGTPVLIAWREEDGSWKMRWAWWDAKHALLMSGKYRGAWTDDLVIDWDYGGTSEYYPTHWHQCPAPPEDE